MGITKFYPVKLDDNHEVLDHCGIIAAFSSADFDFFETGLKGLQVLQTRGYDGAGFWAQNSSGIMYQYKGIGMINEVFSMKIREKYQHVKAKTWIYQVRYGTNGNSSPDNVQPFIQKHKFSSNTFVVAHNGQFSLNKKSKKQNLSDTAIFTQQLAKTSGPTWDKRIINILKHKQGAWSMTIGMKDCLYLARDKYGFRPLIYGNIFNKYTNKSVWMVASETSALEAMGIKKFWEILPGMILKITDQGIKTLVPFHKHERALCIFENVYIHHGLGKAFLPRAKPRQINKSPTIDHIRHKCGKILAYEAPLSKKDVDMVIGVPGTGIEGGMIYARTLDLPYFQAITDRHDSLHEQRTFMTAYIESIYQKVLRHFKFDRQALKNRNVVLVDDSIVRGNITRGLIYLLKKCYQVRAVHLRILSPPIDKTCHLGVNTRHKTELVAAKFKNNIEKIRIFLGAKSLVYLSPGGLKEAITGKSKTNGFCMGCMKNMYPPIDIFGRQIIKT